MTTMHDVIVIGGGSMGAAAAWQLAQKGKNVLALEQFDIPHTKGSYHGESRLIRFAYKQGDHYVPLLLRARDLWREIEQHTGEKLFFDVGGLSIAAPETEAYLEGVYRSVKKYDIPHKVMTWAEVNKQYPAFNLPHDFIAVHDSWAGYLLSEKAVPAFARLAQAAGANIMTNTKVLSWGSDGSTVTVTTDKGAHKAEKLVIAPGAWFSTLVPEFNTVLKTIRVAISWYAPQNKAAFTPDKMPIFIMRDRTDRNGCYGLPICDAVPGMKIGQHFHLGEEVTGDSIDRAPTPADEHVTRYWTDTFFDLKDAPCLNTAICMYTKTPDEAFILGLHPRHENVILGHACSGHGFKFAPVIGEILSDLATDGTTRHDIAAHMPQRFQQEVS